MRKAQKDLAEKFKVPMAHLYQTKKSALYLLAKKLEDFIDKKDAKGNVVKEAKPIDIKDVKDILQLIKVELQEPNIITKNFNENK